MNWKRAQRNPLGYEAAAPKGPAGTTPTPPDAKKKRGVTAAQARARMNQQWTRAHTFADAIRIKEGLSATVWQKLTNCRVYLKAKGVDLGHVDFCPNTPTLQLLSTATDEQRARIAAALEERT